MTRITDGRMTLEIIMNNWTGDGYTSDWSADFFEVGCLHYNEDLDAYMVENVEYCKCQAEDWENNVGDYLDYDADPEEVDNRNVYYVLYPYAE